MLVSAFRATLEEVLEADVILHVRDISHEDTDAQSADVEAILTGLGIDASDHRRLLEVWNKLDLLDADRASLVTNAARRRGANDTRPILVSALTGEGEDRLTAAIEDRLAEGRPVLDLALDPTDGQGLAWLYEHVEVLSREDGDEAILLRVRVAGGAGGAGTGAVSLDGGFFPVKQAARTSTASDSYEITRQVPLTARRLARNRSVPTRVGHTRVTSRRHSQQKGASLGATHNSFNCRDLPDRKLGIVVIQREYAVFVPIVDILGNASGPCLV